jgi:hypothetical protein
MLFGGDLYVHNIWTQNDGGSFFIIRTESSDVLAEHQFSECIFHLRGIKKIATSKG